MTRASRSGVATSVRLGMLLAAGLSGFADWAGAQASPHPESAPDVPAPPASAPTSGRPETLAITVSGGASLGSYEAGYLYYVTQMMHANPGALELRVVTGASAGSTNALLTLLASCLPPEPEPERSLFHQVWSEITFSELFDPEHAEAVGVLRRAPLERIADAIGVVWERGLPASCDVVLGISATRVDAYAIDLRDETVHLPRTEEKFQLRVRGRGAGRPPELSNYVDTEHGAATARLPVDGDRPGEFAYLRDLVLASSAFPLAFSPQRLRYCIHDPRSGPVPPCTPENARGDLFIDGGILDNQPLNLAARVARRGLVADGEAGHRHSFLDLPDARRHELPDDLYFLYLDPGTPAYPAAEAPAEDDRGEEDDAVSFLLRLAGNFVDSARAKELRSIIEEYPEIHDRIRLARSYYPPIATPLRSFFALFDRDLAHFDFVLGMYDARRLLRTEYVPSWVAAHGTSVDDVRWPEPPEPAGVYRELACMRGLFDGDATLARACEGLDAQGFLAVLQTTAERLYAGCRAVGAAGPRVTAHAECWRAELRDPPPRLPGRRDPGDAWLPREGESELAYVVRRLVANGFVFEDLGLTADDADRALLRIREELGLLAAAFRRAQPRFEVLVAATAEVLLNQILYVPPRYLVYVDVVPRLAAGFSYTNSYGRAPWLRLNVGLGFDGFTSLLSSESNYFALVPSTGLEFEPVRWSGAIFRLRFGVHAGYSLSTADDFGAKACASNGQQLLRCSRLFTAANVVLALADIVRVSVGVAYAPPMGDVANHGWAIAPAIGLAWRSSQ